MPNNIIGDADDGDDESKSQKTDFEEVDWVRTVGVGIPSGLLVAFAVLALASKFIVTNKIKIFFIDSIF